jgi:predicted helicase
MFQDYFSQITAKFQNGDSSERTYYTVLHDLIKDFLEKEMKMSNVSVDIEPRSLNSKYSEERLGIPDLRITSNNNLLGYVECKDIGVDLDKIQKTEQLRKYKNLPNLLLTNFLEWRWWNGEEWVKLSNYGQKISVCSLDYLKIQAGQTRTTQIFEEQSNFEGLKILLDQFFNFGRTVLETRNSDQLAQVLAKRAKSLEYVLDISLKEEQTAENEMLFTLFETLKSTFNQNLELTEFASLYAETIAYSALITKLNNSEQIKNSAAIINNIPSYIPLLKQFFSRFGETQNESRQIHKAVEDVLNVVLKSDIANIQEELTQTYHPIYHFYETFLKYFKPEEKSKLGVYYTPEPVVKFIVQSTIQLLKTELNKESIDPGVVWIDPAVGTGTFLFYLIDEIIKTNPNLAKEIYQDFVLSNIFGFEIQLPSYVMAHLKLARQMESFGLKPSEILTKQPILPQTQTISFKPGFRLYLTNTLKDIEQNPEKQMKPVFGFEKLTKEVNETNQVKSGKVLVILGNPPYYKKSGNKGLEFQTVEKYLENYKKGLADENKFENKNWLGDDYIKFLAWSSQKIEQNGSGIVSMIINNSFLDGKTTKLLRQDFLSVYDEIYITNLHGNGLTTNEKDDNVFDIQSAGVCILFFIKKPKSNPSQISVEESRKLRKKASELKNNSPEISSLLQQSSQSTKANLYYTEVEKGSRKNKFNQINNLNVENKSEWTKLTYSYPDFYFEPKNIDLNYQKWWSVKDIFKENGIGFVTARDKFVIDVDKNNLENRLKDYWDLENSEREILEKYKIKDYRNFKIEKFRKENSFEKDKIIISNYRPFDQRWVYYDRYIVQEWQFKTEKHLLPNFGLDKSQTELSEFQNLALIVKRQNRKKPFSYFFVTNQITESCFFEATYANANLCPLYILKDQKKVINDKRENLDIPESAQNLVEINFTDKFQNYIKAKFKLDFEGWEKQVFAYIYGFLHDPNYGEKYFEFLQYDFPRINFEVSKEEFEKVANLGQKLIDLHLLKNVPKNSAIKFENRPFEKLGFYDKNEKAWYLQHQEVVLGVSPEVWEYKIGGYQVLQNLWKNRLKDMERPLNLQEKMWLLEVINCLNESQNLISSWRLVT